MDELFYRSATELALAIHRREHSSEEVVAAHLARIDAVNGRLNAVVQLDAERAIAAAREADAALARGEQWGALHGVPMTIKDSLDTAGVISTGGTLGRASFKPRRDATVVRRLKDAGAILLGKTNTPELTLSFETNNAVYGRTNNPYDLTRSAGGSSGGAAAIIASGGSPFDIGSDYGGSIRLPSHFCGIAGIKPTAGRVPRTGHIIPYAAGAADSFQTLGPMARTVSDLALLLPLIAGPDWEDPAIVPMPLGDPDAVDLGQLRVAFHTDNGAATPIAEITQAITEVALSLDGHVQDVEESCPDRLEETWEIWWSIHGADGGAGLDEILRQAGTVESGLFRQRPHLEAESGAEFGRRLRALDRFRSDLLRFMGDYDVLLAPANANVAVPHGTAYEQYAGFSYTASYNLTGWPAAVVRAGTAGNGLPIGVQIIAAPAREDIVLAVAQFVEAEFGGWQPPDLG